MTAPDTRRLERSQAAKEIAGVMIGCVVTIVVFGMLSPQSQMPDATVALTWGGGFVLYVIVYHAALRRRAPPRPAGDRPSLQEDGS